MGRAAAFRTARIERSARSGGRVDRRDCGNDPERNKTVSDDETTRQRLNLLIAQLRVPDPWCQPKCEDAADLIETLAAEVTRLRGELATVTAERDGLSYAISAAEVDNRIADGNLWRFWRDKAWMHLASRRKAEAALDAARAEGLRMALAAISTCEYVECCKYHIAELIPAPPTTREGSLK